MTKEELLAVLNGVKDGVKEKYKDAEERKEKDRAIFFYRILEITAIIETSIKKLK